MIAITRSLIKYDRVDTIISLKLGMGYLYIIIKQTVFIVMSCWNVKDQIESKNVNLLTNLNFCTNYFVASPNQFII